MDWFQGVVSIVTHSDPSLISLQIQLKQIEGIKRHPIVRCWRRE